jgi:hypothetical protein
MLKTSEKMSYSFKILQFVILYVEKHLNLKKKWLKQMVLQVYSVDTKLILPIK